MWESHTMTPGCLEATDLAISALDDVLNPTTLMLQQILTLVQLLIRHWKNEYFLNQLGWRSVCGSRRTITVALTFEKDT